jgi:hypothetical protein
MEVPQHRVQVHHLLAPDLEHDPQDAVGGRMLRSDVDEHLAVAQGVELGLALGPRRVRRDRLEDADLLVEHDPRVVGGGVLGGALGGGHRRRRIRRLWSAGR